MKTLLVLLISFAVGISSLQAQWTTQTVPPNMGLISDIHIIDPNVIWAKGNGIAPSWNAPILRTTNGGTTWSAIPVNIAGLNGQFSLFSLEALDANTAFAVISLNNPGTGAVTRIYKTADAGLTWTAITGIFTSPDSWANFVQFFDMNNGLAFGDNQEIYTTNNGGNTWSAVPAANLPPNAANLDVSLDRRTVVGNMIWVPVNGLRIYKSIDKGLHWTVTTPTFSQPVFGSFLEGLAFQDANNGLTSFGNRISRTTDGGQTWTPVTPAGNFFRHGITHVTGTPNSYVIYSDFVATPGFSVTKDNGLTWTLIDSNVHSSAAFINSQTGWSGGNETMYKLAGNILSTPKEAVSANSFLIYPNPGQGLFHITAAAAGAFTLEVYDLVGNMVVHQESNSFGKNTLDLSGQKKGVYLLHIKSGEQRMVEKIVLQ
jgi:photosystem II stability/assembly factor-like uncharacterized protein